MNWNVERPHSAVIALKVTVSGVAMTYAVMSGMKTLTSVVQSGPETALLKASVEQGGVFGSSLPKITTLEISS